MNVKEHRRKVLRKLKFVKKEGRKHEIWIFDAGKVRVRTVVSRGTQDIGDGLLKTICRQLHVSISQYRKIVSCKMSKENYYKHLVDTEIV